jgi:hypothetical protein
LKQLIFILLCLYCLREHVSAQFIFEPKKNIETLQREIDKYESSQLKAPIPFSGIRIIDTRYDTTNIGLFLYGYLTLKDVNQPTALQHIINKYYHSLYTTGKDSLIIELEQLNIQDAIMHDTAFTFTAGLLHCTLYIGSNNNYICYSVYDTVMKEKFERMKTYDAHKNGKHYNYDFWDYYLLRLFDATIMEAVKLKDSILNNDHYTAETIKQEGLQKRNKPVLTDTLLRPGFYRNFEEFVNNNPTFLYRDAESLLRLLTVMHYRTGKHTPNEMPDTSYWGYCDGRHIFIRYMYNFYRLEKKDACFYIAPTLDAMRRQVHTSGWNLLIGLAALSSGVALKEGVNFGGFSAIPEPEVPMVILPGNNYYTLGLRLNWDTGSITY